MSAIPPDIAGSAAQAGYTVAEARRASDAERAGQASAAQDRVKAADDAAESVETTDGDTAVFADAEGAGGQGRDFADAGDEQATGADDSVKPGERGQGEGSHLDIQV